MKDDEVSVFIPISGAGDTPLDHLSLLPLFCSVRWTLRVSTSTEGNQLLAVRLFIESTHGSISMVEGARMILRGKSYTGGVPLALCTTNLWLPQDSEGIERMSVTLHRAISRAEVAGVEICLPHDELREVRMGRVGALFERPSSVFNTCLLFAHGRRLYVDPAFLSSLSPYWAARLAQADNFSDSTSPTAPPPPFPAPSDDPHNIKIDLDFEIDANLEIRPPGPPPSADVLIRTFPVSDFSYTTYLAVLTHAYSNDISFLPDYFSKLSPSARETAYSTFSTTYPSTPFPSSAKSVYRLAHFLQLPQLQQLALHHLASQLNPSNVLSHLFDARMHPYDEYVECVWAYFKAHLEEVLYNEDAVQEMELCAMKGAVGGDEAGDAPSVATRLYWRIIRRFARELAARPTVEVEEA